MALQIDFAFVGEGRSDDYLIPHLEALCVKYGADEARGIALNHEWVTASYGKTVSDQVHAAISLEPQIDLVFVHRDADSRNPEQRSNHIIEEVNSSGVEIPCVAVVPVQETEAWLLTSEVEIRQVADNPRGTCPLDLPKLGAIERTASPKEVLKKAIADASEASGLRLKKVNRSFGKRRNVLIERLDICGPVARLGAWKRLEGDIEALIASFLE